MVLLNRASFCLVLLYILYFYISVCVLLSLYVYMYTVYIYARYYVRSSPGGSAGPAPRASSLALKQPRQTPTGEPVALRVISVKGFNKGVLGFEEV